MKKPITPFAHGVMDYATVATVAAAPALLDFPEEACTACYTLAAGYAGLSMFTDYPLAVRRALPFKAHGAAEAFIGAMLPALPWMLGFSHHARARNFFLGLTALTAMTAVLTDWDKESERAARRRHKRKPRLVRSAA